MVIVEDIWAEILKESKNKISLEPDSESLFQEKILSCNGLDVSLSAKLADDLATKEYPSEILKEKFNEVFSNIDFLEKAFSKKSMLEKTSLNFSFKISDGYSFVAKSSASFADKETSKPLQDKIFS